MWAPLPGYLFAIILAISVIYGFFVRNHRERERFGKFYHHL